MNSMIPSAQICGAFSANTPGGAFQPRLPGTKPPEDVHNTMSGPGHFFPGTGFSEKDYNDLMVFSQPGLCFFQNCFQITEYILVAMTLLSQTYMIKATSCFARFARPALSQYCTHCSALWRSRNAPYNIVTLYR